MQPTQAEHLSLRRDEPKPDDLELAATRILRRADAGESSHRLRLDDLGVSGWQWRTRCCRKADRITPRWSPRSQTANHRRPLRIPVAPVTPRTDTSLPSIDGLTGGQVRVAAGLYGTTLAVGRELGWSAAKTGRAALVVLVTGMQESTMGDQCPQGLPIAMETPA